MAKKAKDFNCDACGWGQHCDDNNPAVIEQWEIPGVIESRICLKPMITDQSRKLIRLYWHYKNNILPYSGGLYDQPHKYVEAMEIIEGTFSNG